MEQLPVFKYDLSGFIIEFVYTSRQHSLSTVIKSESSTIDKVMYQIANNQSVTIIELAKKLEVTNITIERAIKQLQTENKITRIGSDRSGSWKVTGE